MSTMTLPNRPEQAPMHADKPPMPAAKPAISYDNESLFRGLVDNGLIVPTAVPGTFGRTAAFETVLERFDGLVRDLAKHDAAEHYTFPPVIDRKILEKVGYLGSFPQLCGCITSFKGDRKRAQQLVNRIADGEPYNDLLDDTDVVLNPAACYPFYPTLKGRQCAGGRLATMLNWVYRHEPSPEPTRMQSYRVREFVRVGTRDEVMAWRDMWLQRAMDLLLSLGLPARSDLASDPFFGRTASMLAAGQIEMKLKYEILVPVISEENPTAVASFNFHQDHFGKNFEIETSDGQVANTACLGFGLERVVMALFKTHGYRPQDWPADIRRKLWD